MRKAAKGFLSLFRFNKKKRYLGGNRLTLKKSLFYKTKAKFKGKGNEIQGSNSVFVNCSFRFFGSNNKIVIGEECVLIDVEFWLEGDSNTITIGNNCDFRGRTQLAALEGTSISIGNNCLFSSDIMMRTGDSHSILNERKERINASRSINIEDKTWIGTKVLILKGTSIPANSIVGAGSVVTKSFATPNVVIAGNPAKVVKHDIDWDKKLL